MSNPYSAKTASKHRICRKSLQDNSSKLGVNGGEKGVGAYGKAARFMF
jgi:hypothetical protein